jgi:ADP-dependent NAD(P)H-hydrate dehydratase / NAD(P)H-hydrate epimerase
MPKIPVISVEQMRQWEKASWAAGKTEREVIQQVGRLLAQRILQLTRPGDGIWILAGKGHNGDDARAAQPYLPDRNVLLMNIDDPRQGAAEFSQRLQTPGAGHARWIIDALFGIGLNRALSEDWRNLIEAINRCGIPVLAVDVPSGLNADTGGTEGAAIKAALTLTLAAPKRGLLEAPAFTGRLEVEPEIGLIPCRIESELQWTAPGQFAGLPPSRASAGNKGDYGHVAIVAGSLGYHGAAVLTAHGALRAQPGLVTVFPQPPVYAPVAAQLQSAMVHPWRAGAPLPKTCTSILFGPGLAAEDLPETLRKELRSLWRSSPLAMVVDASALDWLEPVPAPPDAVRVITPHPGEAGRLLRSSAKDVQAGRLAALRALSKRFCNCWVVLKGQQTLVGRAEGEVFVNSSGNPHLAQGGSGDLLGGYLAGLLAQPDWRKDPSLAARYAVWQHGAAADHLEETQANWTVDDLAQCLGRIKPKAKAES